MYIPDLPRCVIFLRRKCFCRVQILGAALDIPQLEPVERKWHSVWDPPPPLEFNSSLQPIFNFLLHIKVSTLKLFHEWETKRKLLSDALIVMAFSFQWQSLFFQFFFQSHFVFTASSKSIWFAACVTYCNLNLAQLLLFKKTLQSSRFSQTADAGL